jgi:hypothetical protein
LHQALAGYTVQELTLLRDSAKMGREYNERRAAEVREIRFE